LNKSSYQFTILTLAYNHRDLIHMEMIFINKRHHSEAIMPEGKDKILSIPELFPDRFRPADLPVRGLPYQPGIPGGKGRDHRNCQI
jgi:hypothetical protein